MWTLGIDVAKRRHRATLLDDDGQTVFRNVSVEHSREGVGKLLQRLSATDQPADTVVVGMEATAAASPRAGTCS